MTILQKASLMGKQTVISLTWETKVRAAVHRIY